MLTIFEQFDLDYFADLPDWRVEDKAWLKQRREEWKQIEPLWLQTKLFTRKQLRVLRPFFITGQIDRDEFEDWSISRDYSHLDFMLLCPRQDFDFLKAYYDRTNACYGGRDAALKHYKHFYVVSVMSAQEDIYRCGDNGLFMGQDELYAKIFYADVLNAEEQFDTHGTYMPRQYPHPPGLFFEWYLGYVAFFLLGITRYPYVRQQYLDETWYASIVHNTKPYAECKNLPLFLQSIYYFDELNESDPLGNRKQLATRLQTMLDERPLPDELAKLWASIKTASGRDFAQIDTFKERYLGQNVTLCEYMA